MVPSLENDRVLGIPRALRDRLKADIAAGSASASGSAVLKLGSRKRIGSYDS